MAIGGGGGAEPTGSPEPVRRVWIALGTLALVTLVAVMSDGSLLHAARTSDQIGRYLLIALGVAITAGAAISVVIVAMALRGRPPLQSRKPSLLRSLFAMAVALMLALAFGQFLHRVNAKSSAPPPPTLIVTTSTSCQGSCPPAHAHAGASPWWLAVAIGVMAITALIVGGRRRPETASADDTLPVVEETAISLFDASIDDLEAEPDPRRAIIAAYARLLDGLAACGLGRRLPETPAEHLDRALNALNVAPGPLERLTGLFAEARFSVHPLTTEHKEAAIEAFRGARDSLRPWQRKVRT